METSHVGVRRRHAMLYVGLLLDGSCQERVTGHLPDRGTPNRCELTELEDGFIRDTRRASAGKTRVHVECVALLGA